MTSTSAAGPDDVAERRGAAGRKGAEVRSDVFATVELTEVGGLSLDVESKVAVLYADSIRATASTVLADMGVEHARVRLEDQGALPFVLAARVEAAARRAGVDGRSRPPRTAPVPPASERYRPRRSRLYLPGQEPKFMVNAGLFGADGVILDLEDSVHPDQKDAARLLVRNALRCVGFFGAERMVRINQLPLGLEDLEAVVPEHPDLVLLPKTELADQVVAVARRIEEIQARESESEIDGTGERRAIWLMPILESPLGIENAFAIATATDTVAALTIGLEDYTAELGVVKTREGAESHYARARLVNVARAAGVQAIDSVYGDVDDQEGLVAWARRARSMGFEGMGCIHPRQIRPLHAAFAPSAEEVEKAVRVVTAFEEAQARGLAVVSLGSRMIDPPVVLRAQRIVALARQLGQADTESNRENVARP